MRCSCTPAPSRVIFGGGSVQGFLLCPHLCSLLALCLGVNWEAPSRVILGFPRVGQGDVLFLWQINSTNLVFLLSRLIWLDTEHSRLAFLAWQAGGMALQHLPAKNRCYFSPGSCCSLHPVQLVDRKALAHTLFLLNGISGGMWVRCGCALSFQNMCI